MTDEQRRQVVEKMKSAMQYGEVEYDAGMELRSITGWFGITDLAPGESVARPSPFGPLQTQAGSRSIAVGVVVVQDIETPIHDQETTTVPWQRVLTMRAAPRMP